MALGSVLSPWASCFVLCRTMISCQASGDLVRAQQWVDAAREGRQRGGPVPLSGDCRVHHAGLLNWRGEWAEAEEEEATVGCAEELLAHAHELGSTPRPALALAHWARGRGRAALAMLEAALEDERAPVLRAPLQRAARTLRELSGDADLLTSHRVRRTFMFTDIVRSTPLLEALGDDAWSDLVRWHDATLRAQFAAHAGQEVDRRSGGRPRRRRLLRRVRGSGGGGAVCRGHPARPGCAPAHRRLRTSGADRPARR
jgi:hypothetical protein